MLDRAILWLSLLLAGESLDGLASPRFAVRRAAQQRIESMHWALRPAIQKVAASADAHTADAARRLLAVQSEWIKRADEYAYVFRLICGNDGVENEYGFFILAGDEDRIRAAPERIKDTIEQVGRLTLLLEAEVPAYRCDEYAGDPNYRVSVLNVLRSRAHFYFEMGCCRHVRKRLHNGRLLELLPEPREVY